jgi:hypothetical protein
MTAIPNDLDAQIIGYCHLLSNRFGLFIRLHCYQVVSAIEKEI